MIYILCEGEKDKAEYNFINAIVTNLRSKNLYTLIPCDGNKNIESKFNSTIKNVKSGDTLVLVLDNVAYINKVPVSSLLLSFERKCTSKNVIFRHTDYYCIEEVFLSYTGLFSIISLNNNDSLYLRRLQDEIRSGKNYIMTDTGSYWKQRLDKYSLTREKLSFAILVYVLTNQLGKFKIVKEYIGDCWIMDCRLPYPNGVQYVCNKCKFKCKDCTFLEKLADLDNNSVSSISKPFSSILD